MSGNKGYTVREQILIALEKDIIEKNCTGLRCSLQREDISLDYQKWIATQAILLGKKIGKQDFVKCALLEVVEALSFKYEYHSYIGCIYGEIWNPDITEVAWPCWGNAS